MHLRDIGIEDEIVDKAKSQISETICKNLGIVAMNKKNYLLKFFKYSFILNIRRKNIKIQQSNKLKC